ncbi:MAG: WG repeat-containing protein [Bacillota bacterium]|nr:WG repeat-containing protein [Bacillota bacterium]
MIIPYQYEEVIEPFNGQGLAVVKSNGERVIINTKGEVVAK